MPTGPRIIPADVLPRWSRYSAMLRDCGHDGIGKADGILHREELKAYMDGLQHDRTERVRNRESTNDLDVRLIESRQLLADMDAMEVDALNYLPAEVRELQLSPSLNRRCVELLMVDDDLKLGRVVQSVIDNARARYMTFDVRTAHMLDVQRNALDDIDELAEKLGLI
jgi:hypothetical protein